MINVPRINAGKETTKILLFTYASCVLWGSTEKELKRLANRRNELRLVAFHRADVLEKVPEYNFEIWPAVYMDDRSISYRRPDTRKLESISGTGKVNRHKMKQLKTNLRGESK